MKLKTLFKKLLTSQFIKIKAFERPAIKYCIENKLLPSILTRSDSNIIREQFNLPVTTHWSQLNQDIMALIINKFKFNGYFIEIGANDGFNLSNTFYLESEFSWEGLLIEANPKYIPSLNKRKNSTVINKAVSENRESLEFIDDGLYGGLSKYLYKDESIKVEQKILVECDSLDNILRSAKSPQVIDFISIDIEGGELEIVKQLVNSAFKFRCGCIEHNYRKNDYEEMSQLLEKHQYKIIWNNRTYHDLFFIRNDDTFIK